MNIRLPHITGFTNEEKIVQIVGYLRQLAMELERLPEPVTAPAIEEKQIDGVRIVGRGEKDGWMWRKFSDGTAECWKKEAQTVAVTGGWGNLFYGYCTTSSFPFSFAEPPVCVASAEQQLYDQKSVWLASHKPATENSTPQYLAISAESVGDADIYITYHAIGRWK